MPIKVYFGPWNERPKGVGELKPDESHLWVDDLHFLRGYDSDFWTSNPLHLDYFAPDQIYIWQGEWVLMSEHPMLDKFHRKATAGQAAVTLCAMFLARQLLDQRDKLEP